MVPFSAHKKFIDRIVPAKEFDGENSTWLIFFLIEGIKLTGHVTPPNRENIQVSQSFQTWSKLKRLSPLIKESTRIHW